MFDQALLQPGTHAREGVGQWLSEGVATFGLLLTILLGIAHRPAAVPALVGAYIFAAYWFTGSTSFANPAVTLARSLTQSFAGIVRPTCRGSSSRNSSAQGGRRRGLPAHFALARRCGPHVHMRARITEFPWSSVARTVTMRCSVSGTCTVTSNGASAA
jgi:hypothetical protein